ncbi:unnamed protein product [Caenorhabditis angaria]|uniref:Major sperm protein n=1 Tax=Caenorhabditis angaria TaxID=860376 RepID=A0A9P1I3U0_9PELO|nr:unnamed protein product [Caenorhabditis angaria]
MTSTQTREVPLGGIKDLVDAGPSIIANKPTEPPSKLGLSAKQITFVCKDDKKPVAMTIKIFNPTNEVFSFKVRCTSSEYFRVQPPIGTLPPKTSKELSLWYNNAGKALELNNKHYFAFYHYKGDCKESREVLNGKVEGVRRLPAIFEMK